MSRLCDSSPIEGLPLVAPLPTGLSALEAFQRLKHWPHCLFLDSALKHPTLGRWSFLAVDPVAWHALPSDAPAPLDELSRSLRRYAAPAVSGLPPFQGGWAGLFAYELGRSFERLPRPRYDAFGLPAVAAGLYDVVVAFDHVADCGWILSQGLPEIDPQRRHRRARVRLEQILAGIAGAGAVPSAALRESPMPIARSALAPQFPVSGGLTSDFSRDGYLRTVQRVIDWIAAGDVFQVNLSQQLLHPADEDSATLYLRLREKSAAPFAGYFDLGDCQILSASPERFLRVANRHVETRPIKGTRRRTGIADADARTARELLLAEKDRAENVMIVDLLRNDLTRVCRPASVRVTGVCNLEAYAHVFHLVSVVEGDLRDGAGPLDLLQAAMPGGSVTGAPKIRAMEIIAQLEPAARGAYCGAMGYVGLDGSMDLNILIRTITAGRGWWQIPVGGGVVADSDPEAEYQETWDKAEGLLRALR